MKKRKELFFSAVYSRGCGKGGKVAFSLISGQKPTERSAEYPVEKKRKKWKPLSVFHHGVQRCWWKVERAVEFCRAIGKDFPPVSEENR